MIPTDPDLADRLGYPYAGWLRDGRVAGIMSLTEGRGRLWVGTEYTVQEFW